MDYNDALSLVRILIDRGLSREDAVNNPAIPEEYRIKINEQIHQEEVIILEPVGEIYRRGIQNDWINNIDRSYWYYWNTLRQYSLNYKKLPLDVVRSIDSTTDRILGFISDPNIDRFNIRGLVLGYVQSGKTANYTALIAKAADLKYRLIIVLSGIDNGLRRQTQIRLKKELVGYTDNRKDSVPLPPCGLRWHEFTTEEINGDFQAGNANHAALQGPQPVLLVIKKNGAVLRRLLQWLEGASDDIKQTIPVLVIDDEADQASIDTRGTYQPGGTDPDEEYESPSVINQLIRQILRTFNRSSYVAYTATPYANLLIPHDTENSDLLNDLFPSDFIITLPKPKNYFGAEELFGINGTNGEGSLGLDVVREVTTEDLNSLSSGIIPQSLEEAILDFILAGATRAYRKDMDKPVTMLIHISRLIVEQNLIGTLIDSHFQSLKDEWRYQRNDRILNSLKQRWEEEFRPITLEIFPERDVGFDQIEQQIGPFFESVKVKIINSETGDVLDYEREPRLKAIAIGGDRLSRGLTLEGLLISYFVRRSPTYDTLMQMGRWFGYRSGFEDITRIYTTNELSGWFSDLALVETQLREDTKLYEILGLSPYMVGTRILQHPSMQVTNPLKRRHSRSISISQSYSGERAQTFKFPFDNPELLIRQEDNNLKTIKAFLPRLGAPRQERDRKGPVWENISYDLIIDFLKSFNVEIESGLFSPELICEYILRMASSDELLRWTVAIRGLESTNSILGEVDWGIPGKKIRQIKRTKLINSNSLGVITSTGDELIGFTSEQRERVNGYVRQGIKKDIAARLVRSAEEGLLLLYPISRFSGHEKELNLNRKCLFDDPTSPDTRDLIGLAISFPESNNPQPVEAYLVGTAGWRPIQ